MCIYGKWNLQFSSLKLELLLFSIDVTKGGITTSFNDWQSQKAPSPITVTDGGIVTSFINKQQWKAYSPIEVVKGGIVTFSKPWQLSKHFYLH